MIEINSLAAMKQVLQDHHIDFSGWGAGEAKTLSHLFTEIAENETALVVDDSGQLLRKVDCIGLKIYHTNDEGKRFLLTEQKQVFTDGRVRSRQLEVSLAEKMAVGESPVIAAIRGLQEELGVKADINGLTGMMFEPVVDTRISTSYPNLWSQYTIINFDVKLTNKQYEPTGYVEVQKDKSTYFVWLPIGEDPEVTIKDMMENFS
jgi:hypothetical protein